MKSKKVIAPLLKARGEAKAGSEEEATPLRTRASVSVREAKDQMSALLQRVADGEEIVVTSDGQPKAMLVKYRPIMGGKAWRPLGAFLAGQPLGPDSTKTIRAERDSRR
ncbi:MAG: type II toxin-antitoxin system prevent-host-death family antitoxin [Opitutaceae bacterium]|nr:type II toxin-antitoxin system prevent-host-death family antitoxin [Opitutaceae bacterium]